jgi:hypothetical protein
MKLHAETGFSVWELEKKLLLFDQTGCPTSGARAVSSILKNSVIDMRINYVYKKYTF